MGRKAALVLSGGGALGAAHLGVVSVLKQIGYTFDFFSGVSAGALVCALLASGRLAEECLEILKRTNFMRLSFDFSRRGYGFIRGKKIQALFDELFGDLKFEDLSAPLYVGATNFQTGERVIISSGKITDALRASISVPIVFEPYFHQDLGLWLADGGLTMNLPLDVVSQNYKGDRIISVDVATTLDTNVNFSKAPVFFKGKMYARMMMRTLRIFLKNQLPALPADSREIRIVPDFSQYTAIDIRKMHLFVEEGRRAAEAMKDVL